MKVRPFCAVFIFVWFFNQMVKSQADINMATHWYNRANYNPAFIARTDFLYVFSNYRQQWVGVNGAPRVINVQASEYVHNLRSAFGLSFVSDDIGAVTSINSMINYAYRISGRQDWSLSLGFSAGMISQSINQGVFQADEQNDPSIFKDYPQKIEPDFNAGFEFQNSNFIFGLSSTHLLSIFNDNSTYLNTNHRYGYFIYKNNQSKYYNYNLGIQIVNRKNLTILEINTIFRIKQQTGLISGAREVIDVGLTVRSSRQITLLFGLNIYSNTRIGYAFDHSFISGYSKNNTHEIVLEWRIPNKKASTRFKCGDNLFWYN